MPRIYTKFLLLSVMLWVSICQGVHGQTYRLFSTENGLTSSLVNYVLEDKYGQIWIATEDGLNRYDGVKISTYKHYEGGAHTLASNYVSTLIEDAQGNLIVSTYRGLQIYRHDTDDFSPVATYTDGKVMRAHISRLMLEKDGRLYGTGDESCELITKDRDRIEIRKMDEPYFTDTFLDQQLPRYMNFRCTLRYDASHMLLGTDDDGVKLYDERTQTFTDYPLDIPGIPQELQKVHSLMYDRKGNLWLGLYQRGVVMVTQEKSMFGYYGPRSSRQNLVGNHCIQSICESKNGGKWVGTDGDGLYYLQGETSQHITEGVPPMINALMEDSEGMLWVGSYGYPCYKQEKGVFHEVEGLPNLPRVFTIKEDHQHNVWLGTMEHGIFCYNLKTKTMKHVEYEGINRYINNMYILSNGEVLAGTFDGVYNITTHQHICPKLIVFAIHEDAKGRLWLGSTEGLVMVKKDKQTYSSQSETKKFTIADGMPSNSVFGISEDESGKLWFSSNSGLSCFDEQEGVFTNFSVSDGLQGNEFSKGAVVKDKDGTLWFGGHQGITNFSAGQTGHVKYDLTPRLTAIYINNVAVNTSMRSGGKAVIDTDIFSARKFRVAYEDNSFSVELSAAEIDRPSECSYCYSLDDGAWISIPEGGHVVTFSNVNSGTHSLRYAVEYNGKRSEAKEIIIEVDHPWWGTLWAKGLLALLVVGIATLIYFWVRSREKVKALALISHKIRTPMSLIISPLLQLIEKETDNERMQTLQLMLRNANRLQDLAAEATEEEPIGPIVPTEGGEEESIQERQASHTSMRLLVVEDDDDVRNYICSQLSGEFHILEAKNGKEALELIFKRQPDAIISDVTMPEMDGITLCKKIKRNIQLAHIPVMLLTARADEESTLQGLGTGADAYVTKPFNIKIVRQKIINLILLRQQLRNTFQGTVLQEDKIETLKVEEYEEKLLDRLIRTVNEHISDPNYSVESLCTDVGISRGHLHRKLKELTNQPATTFIRNIRLKQAERLLVDSDLRIKDICFRVGFLHLSTFSAAFKELYGMSPVEFREQNQKEKGESQ